MSNNSQTRRTLRRGAATQQHQKKHIENTTGSDKKLKSHRIMNIGDYCSMESGQEESTPCSHSLHLTTTASHVNRAAQKVGVHSRFMTKSPYDSTPEDTDLVLQGKFTNSSLRTLRKPRSGNLAKCSSMNQPYSCQSAVTIAWAQRLD